MQKLTKEQAEWLIKQILNLELNDAGEIIEFLEKVSEENDEE